MLVLDALDADVVGVARVEATNAAPKVRAVPVVNTLDAHVVVTADRL
jgi:hypothetical protein